MSYLIDGHNLISKIPEIQLSDIDDEKELIEILLEFCRKRRKHVEVFFDRAAPGQTRARSYGLVIARFVHESSTADEAIRQRLKRLGRGARNWTVVTSDLAVQVAARESHASVISSESFARELAKTAGEELHNPEKSSEVTLKEDEVEEWLNLFTHRKDSS